MRRMPLLERNPDVGPVTLPLLVGIATAVEQESARRYAELARTMELRGDHEVAQAFRRMLEEELAHVGAVERWAASLGETTPDPVEFTWRLPEELSSSWAEVARSARLTPYRAFAIAADNEQRAFALYSYLAADADDPQVAEQAERLAKEELRHASLMRRWRREAWHRERREAAAPAPQAPPSAESLHALVARGEAAIASRHRSIIPRLRALGDEESARLLEQMEGASPAPAGIPVTAEAAAPSLDTPVALLVAAQEPLEALGEDLEALLPRLEGERFAEAEQALARVIARIARISLQAEHRMG